MIKTANQIPNKKEKRHNKAVIDTSEILHYLRPPPDPYLRKSKPIVNHEAPKSTGVIELINRGNQLLLELDRQHSRLHEAIGNALSPSPQAWRQVKAAQADYCKAYAELIQLSKRLNRLIQEEAPELIYPPDPQRAYVFGVV